MTERNLIYRVSIAGQTESIQRLTTFQATISKLSQQEVATETLVQAGKNRARKAGLSEAERMQAMAARTESKALNESLKYLERVEKDKSKASAKESNARQRELDRGAKAEQKALNESLKYLERNEREKTKAVEKATRDRARLTENAARHDQRVAERSAQQQQRAADRAAQTRARDAAFDDKRFYRGIGHSLVGGAAQTARQGMNYAASGARGVASGLGLNNAFNITDIIAERMYGQQMMRAAAIEARQAGTSFSASGFDEKNAMKRVRETALSTGLSQRDLFKAIDVYSEKGSAMEGVENIDRIARQAKAMNTDAAVVAKVRAQLGISSKTTGKEMNEAEKDEFVAMMHFSGKTGVFRGEDIAKEADSLFSGWAKAGGDFRGNARGFLNFANEARKSTGSAAMARTSMNTLENEVEQHSSVIHKLGIKTKVKDKDGIEQLRNPLDVLMDVIEKTGGEGKFSKIFTPGRSGKASATLITANRNAGGGKAGRAVMEKMLRGDDSLDKSSIAELNKDADYSIAGEGNSYKRSMERVRQSLGDAIAPSLDKLASKMPQIVEKLVLAMTKLPGLIDKVIALFERLPIGHVADFAIENPMLAMFALNAGPKLGAFGAGRIGDSLVNTVPGIASKFGGGAGKVAGLLGGAISSAGSTPVYVTGMAPGVGGFGGGLAGTGSEAGGLFSSTAGKSIVGGAASMGLGLKGLTIAGLGAIAIGTHDGAESVMEGKAESRHYAQVLLGASTNLSSTIGAFVTKFGTDKIFDKDTERKAKEDAQKELEGKDKLETRTAKKLAAGELSLDDARKYVDSKSPGATDEEREKMAQKLIAGRHTEDAGELAAGGGLGSDQFKQLDQIGYNNSDSRGYGSFKTTRREGEWVQGQGENDESAGGMMGTFMEMMEAPAKSLAESMKESMASFKKTVLSTEQAMAALEKRYRSITANTPAFK